MTRPEEFEMIPGVFATKLGVFETTPVILYLKPGVYDMTPGVFETALKVYDGILDLCAKYQVKNPFLKGCT